MQHDGLLMYPKLLLDPYFQVSTLEAILAWWDYFVLCTGDNPNILCRLQDETAQAEDTLVQPVSMQALLKCFVAARANSFKNLLNLFLKICHILTTVTISVAKSKFFHRIIDHLSFAVYLMYCL